MTNTDDIYIFLMYYNVFEALNKLRNQAMVMNTYQSYETINSQRTNP